jgi:hypothetical protein
VTASTEIVERVSGFLASRLSRRNFVNRSAFVGSAVAVGGGLDLALRPGTAYSAICNCGNLGCGCGTTCCAGYTEFCCSVNGGYNYCPTNTTMGGWWKADGSTYCDGPRYYMDCNANCECTAGCGGGWPFCEPGCDGVNCGCGGGDCNNWVTGCFQFRYGQCNQNLACTGRIVCRVVACVPPWTIDPTCTTDVAVDEGTAQHNAPCWTPAVVPPCSTASTRCEVIAVSATPDGKGYGMVTSFGKFFGFGDAQSAGDVANITLTKPIVGLAMRPVGGGYWFVASDGGVFAFGGAPFFGSMGGRALNLPIVGMAATPTGSGYWFVASDGGIFCFGDAQFYGSMGGVPLNKPIVGMAATPSGKGYWLVATDGGIFCFGDAQFYGSTGAIRLNQPIVGMTPTSTGKGYWMVASDGGIFCFGDAAFAGSEGGKPLAQPMVAIATPGAAGGYWTIAADGGVFAFGAPFYGAPS